MENTILEVEHLRKSYGSLRAVNDMSFTVEKGSVFGILGPNGSGKSTTLSILTGVVNANAGQWSWFDQGHQKNIRTRLGVLLEKPNFYSYLSAVNNLKIVADIRGVDHSSIDDVLKRVGLYERRNSRFSTYSLGMKQRLAIGSVLLGNPEVLILDEPTNGLDPQGIAEVRNLINELSQEGSTIIIASHLLDEIQKVCTHVMVMKKGKSLFNGEVGQLLVGVTKLIVSSDDHTSLIALMQKHPLVTDIEERKGQVVLSVKPECTAAEINAFAFQNDQVLSSLSFESHNLEEKILTLLKEAK